MGRPRSQPKPTTQPPADISPFDSDEEEDDVAGGGIPDDDGWIHLEGKDAKREDEKPKQPARRRAKGSK
jgi:hypothetical protein